MSYASAAAKSELRYRRLFETAQDGILILDAASGKITDANPYLKSMLGYSDLELVGRQLWEIGGFKDVVNSKKAFFELQNKGYIRYEDLPLYTKDNRIIDVEFVSNVYVVDTQTVIQCNIRNITDRKHAEGLVVSRTLELEKLSRSQEATKNAMLNVMEDLEQAKAIIETEKARDEAMLASIGEGLVAVDTERKIVVLNKSAEKMLGWKTKELRGREITSLQLEDEEGNVLSLDKRPTYMALDTGRVVGKTYYFVRKDKSRFPIAINVTPIRLGGKIIGEIDIFRDITREREIDQAKSEFVSLASHQFRTPLGISKWYLEALEGEGILDGVSEKVRDYLAQVYKSNERLLLLVRGLLSVSRIDQGNVKNVPSVVKIAELVQSVMKELAIAAAKSKISLKLVVKEADIPTVFIDAIRLQQVIENLIVNAIEYSSFGGRVVVTVKKKDAHILISVTDTGIGISLADQKKLFTKFFRTANAMAKNTEGAGLGLYVVKSYVEGWGGTITVVSAEGRGSTFTVTLPIEAVMMEKY